MSNTRHGHHQKHSHHRHSQHRHRAPLASLRPCHPHPSLCITARLRSRTTNLSKNGVTGRYRMETTTVTGWPTTWAPVTSTLTFSATPTGREGFHGRRRPSGVGMGGRHPGHLPGRRPPSRDG